MSDTSLHPTDSSSSIARAESCPLNSHMRSDNIMRPTTTINNNNDIKQTSFPSTQHHPHHPHPHHPHHHHHHHHNATTASSNARRSVINIMAQQLYLDEERTRRCLSLGCIRVSLCAISSIFVLVVMVATTIIWAFLFVDQRFPKPIQDNTFPNDRYTQREHLALYSEMVNSIIMSLVYFAKSADELKFLLNQLPYLKGRIESLGIKPNVFTPQSLDILDSQTMVSIIPVSGPHRQSFDLQVKVNLPFSSIHVKFPSWVFVYPIRADNGIFIDADLRLSFPDFNLYKSRVTMTKINKVETAALNGKRISVFGAAYRQAVRFAPSMPLRIEDNPAAQLKKNMESFLSILEENKEDSTGFRSLSSPRERRETREEILKLLNQDHVRAHRHTPKAYLRQPHVMVPDAIDELNQSTREQILEIWPKFLQHIIRTFVFTKEAQEKLTKTLQLLLNISITGIKVFLVEDIDLGIESVDDLPNIALSLPKDGQCSSGPKPYRYSMDMHGHLPNFKMRIGVSGINSMSYVEASITNLRFSSPFVVEVLHPLLVKRPYFSMWFTAMPLVDFDISISAERSKLFGYSVFNDSTWKFIVDLLVKPAIINLVRHTLSVVVYPLSVHIPWVTNPTNPIFMTASAQRIFRTLRYIFSAQSKAKV